MTFLDTEVSLAPTPVCMSEMEVHLAADMELDKVAGNVADMVADKKIWYPILSRGWVNWVKTF